MTKPITSKKISKALKGAAAPRPPVVPVKKAPKPAPVPTLAEQAMKAMMTPKATPVVRASVIQKLQNAPLPAIGTQGYKLYMQAKAVIDSMLERSRQLGEPVVERIVVTPEMAQYILSLNVDNRKIRPVKLTQYVSDMNGKLWQENGQSVIIADNGLLNDGQHRMLAVEDSGMPQAMIIVVGVSRASRITVDTMQGRNVAEVAQSYGFSNGSILTSAARLLLAYRKVGGKTLGTKMTITPSEIMNMLHDDPMIGEATEWAVSARYKMKGLITQTHAALIYYILKEADHEGFLEFLEAIRDGSSHGTSLSTDDARWFVRERLRMLNAGQSHVNRVELMLRAWNVYKNSSKVAGIRISGELPKVSR